MVKKCPGCGAPIEFDPRYTRPAVYLKPDDNSMGTILHSCYKGRETDEVIPVQLELEL